MHERVRLDLQYADQSSFLYDLKLLAKTLRVIVCPGVAVALRHVAFGGADPPRPRMQ